MLVKLGKMIETLDLLSRTLIAQQRCSGRLVLTVKKKCLPDLGIETRFAAALKRKLSSANDQCCLPELQKTAT